MRPDWFLIANATQARLLQRTAGGPITVLKTFSHPAGRSKVSELADDRAGHGSTDRGYGGMSYPPRVDAKRKEHEHFAHELAEHLERAAQREVFRSLVVFSSSPFLGELKAELGAHTRSLLTGTRDVDLTAVGPAELERRITHELAA